MASERDFTLPAPWAENAETTIPATPIAGTTYRNETSPGAGWPHATLVDSADFNQLMYLYSQLLEEVDTRGIPGWSDQVDYATAPAVVRGSDGNFYQSTSSSGPNDPDGARDPITPANRPSHWTEFAGGGLNFTALAAALVEGANVTLDVDGVAETITISSTAGGVTDPEVVRDVIGAALAAGAGIDIAVDDAGNTITITNTALGQLRQRHPFSRSDVVETTATIDADGTVPLNTEGFEIFSEDITIGDAAHRVLATVTIPMLSKSSGAGDFSVATLYRNGILVGYGTLQRISVLGAAAPLVFTAIDNPGTGTHTYSVRIGSEGGTIRVNALDDGSQPFGAGVAATLVIDVHDTV